MKAYFGNMEARNGKVYNIYELQEQVFLFLEAVNKYTDSLKYNLDNLYFRLFFHAVKVIEKMAK